MLQTNKGAAFKQEKRPLQNSQGKQQSDKYTFQDPQGKGLCKVTTHRLKSLLEQPLTWLFPDKATQPKDSTCRLHYAAPKHFKSLLQEVSLYNHLSYKHRNSHPCQAKLHWRKSSSAADQILLPALTMLPKQTSHSSTSLPHSQDLHTRAVSFLPSPPAQTTQDGQASP